MDNLREEDDKTKIILNKMKLTDFPLIPSDIKTFDVRRNSISTMVFPENCQLEQLDASDNVIKSLDPISGLKQLKILDIGYNLIIHIPLLDLPSLKELYLMSNDITKIENMNFNELIKLDLANNDIRSLEGVNCPKLEEIYLGANKIDQLINLKHLQFLKILDLQYNKLDEFDCSLLPESIETILLNNNKGLKKITNLECLPSLKLLGIKNTKIGEIQSNGKFEIW